MPISIYPPTLASTQSAFLATTDNYPIYFTLQSMTSKSNIGHVQVKVVDQQSNSSIVNTSLYPDGIIYKDATAIKSASTEGTYYVEILSSDLRQSWTAGRCYKIQVRFGTTAKYTSISSFADWKKTQVTNETFSEWSSVMVIKAINAPEVEIANAGTLRQDTVNTVNVENTLTPLFEYTWSSDDESLERYKFELYNGESTENEDLIESSSWITANVSNDEGKFSYRFKTILTNNATYTVKLSIVTVNGYETEVDYYFQVIRTYLDAIENVAMLVEGNDDTYCHENGCIKIYLYPTTSNGMSLTGCYVLTRTSEESNYGVYEDIQYFNLFEGSYIKDEPLYTDYTVESGIRYKYGFQYQNSQGLRSEMVEHDLPVCVDFEYSYIYRDGIQLKLSLNQKLSSFKHTVLTSKQDTLGDQFPHLAKNGYAHYAEFPISGTISYQMDGDDTFFISKTGGCYFGNELIIPYDKFKEGESRGSSTAVTDFTIDANPSNNNIFIERKFREKVEEFLNDFNYKLYKSPTEGNIIIGLLNVSMTPNATLGRMIFDFSATAYEVMENTLENLDEVGIIDIGEYSAEDAFDNQVSVSFGQISGVYVNSAVNNATAYPSDKDIYELIRAQEEVSAGDGQYQYNLRYIDSFWIERYPEIDLTGKLCELEAAYQDAEEAGDSDECASLTEEISYYTGLQSAMKNSSAGLFVQLLVNGTEVIVAPNKYYSVEGGIYSLSIVSSPYPVIINYVASLQLGNNDNARVVSSIDVSRVWGQISGVFTDSKTVLQQYVYDYREGEVPYRVYGTNPPASLKESSDDDEVDYSAIEFETDYAWDVDAEYYYVIVDGTNYNLYKTRNLYEIIKEETRKLVEHIYEAKDGFYQDEEGNWTNGEIDYVFSDIISFTIETDPYTELVIGPDEENATSIRLGPTGRYTLSPIDNMVKYIMLPTSQFAIVDYKCLTNQIKYKTEEGE